MPTATRKFLSLREVAQRSPPGKGDRPVHPQTVQGWIVEGVQAVDGRIVRLRGVRWPSGWKVAEDDLAAFLAELTAIALGEDAPPSPEAAPAPSTARRRELADVDRGLDQAGI